MFYFKIVYNIIMSLTNEQKYIIEKKAEEIIKDYNPEGFVPFPYEKILQDKKDLKILMSDDLPENISGIIKFLAINNEAVFYILINKTKPNLRQYFTVAHELGHYFLHKDKIKNNENYIVEGENVLENTGILYINDENISTNLELEANAFAASLIIPARLIEKAWNQFENIEKCAELFKVSVEAMSIRLNKLSFIK